MYACMCVHLPACVYVAVQMCIYEQAYADFIFIELSGKFIISVLTFVMPSGQNEDTTSMHVLSVVCHIVCSMKYSYNSDYVFFSIVAAMV